MGLCVSPNNRKDFFWHRTVRGRATYKSIGEFPNTSIEEARGAASQFSGNLDRLKRGNFHPSLENPFRTRRGEPTLDQEFELYIAKQLRTNAKNPDAAERNARQFFSYVKDWKGRKLSEISKQDVREKHEALGESAGKVAANRGMSLLRSVYLFAERRDDFIGKPPTKDLEYFEEKSRTRYLLPEELPKFFATLKREKNDDLRDFIWLAVFTSARRGDLYSMRWADISFPDNRWLIPSPKSSTPYTVALSKEAIAVLRERRIRAKENATWVFPTRSKSKTGHVDNLNRAWRTFRKRAGVGDIHIHDLRKTLPSYAAAQGASMAVIGRHLGHANSLTATEIYA